MATPSVHTLPNGYLMPADQGNPAFCAVYLIETDDERVAALADIVHPGHDKSFRITRAERSR